MVSHRAVFLILAVLDGTRLATAGRGLLQLQRGPCRVWRRSCGFLSFFPSLLFTTPSLFPFSFPSLHLLTLSLSLPLLGLPHFPSVIIHFHGPPSRHSCNSVSNDSLDRCGIGETGARLIGDSLRGHPRLKMLRWCRTVPSFLSWQSCREQDW